MADERSIRIPMTVARNEPVSMTVEPVRLKRGEDGYSPTVTVVDITGGHRVTITDKNGPHVIDIMNGEDGQDGAPGETGPQGPQGESGAMVVEAVSGSTPSITAQGNTRYVCGTVSTLSFTPCAAGICDVIFESGSTATVLTAPNTIKWPEWFNPANLESNTVYELNVMDGVYGAVGIWT